MYDRRHRSRRSFSDDRTLPSPSSCSEESTISLELRELPDLEQELSHHYLNVFLSVLLLPTVRESDLEGYGSQVMSMMLRSESVKCAVLAACASNKYMLLRSRKYHDAALGYYFRAVELVNRALHDLGASAKGPDDPLLTTVVYLYLYDVSSPLFLSLKFHPSLIISKDVGAARRDFRREEACRRRYEPAQAQIRRHLLTHVNVEASTPNQYRERALSGIPACNAKAIRAQLPCG